MTNEEFQALKCRQKTKRRNVYALRVTAESVASKVSDIYDANVRAYQCTHCNRWHVGNKGRKLGQKRKRKNRKRRS